MREGERRGLPLGIVADTIFSAVCSIEHLVKPPAFLKRQRRQGPEKVFVLLVVCVHILHKRIRLR